MPSSMGKPLQTIPGGCSGFPVRRSVMCGEMCSSLRVCSAGNKPGRKGRTLFKQLSRLVAWAALAAVGILVIPILICSFLIRLLWEPADRLASWLQRKGEE